MTFKLATFAYLKALYLFISNYDAVFEKFDYHPLNYFEYFIIFHVSCTQCAVFFGVSYILIKQLYYIYSGAPFHFTYKKKNIESYYPCININNTDHDVKTFLKDFSILI